MLMNLMKASVKVLIGVWFLFPLGCVTNPGVEVGNPNLPEGPITVVSTKGQTLWVFENLDPNRAKLTKIEDEQYESVEVPIAYEQNLLVFRGTFSDGATVEFFLNLSPEGEILQLSLFIDGVDIPVTFETQESELACPLSEDFNAQTIAETLCSKIVACNTVYSCGDCVSNVVQVPGLANQFGEISASTLEESDAGIEDGSILVDEENFDQCTGHIEIIPCIIVNGYFVDSEAPNYNSVKEIIPKPTCSKGILKNKE